MLNYHILLPHYSKQHNAEYLHYLELGSHEAPYGLDSIAAFSIITLHSQQTFPEIQNNLEKKYVTYVIPLKGRIKVNGKHIEAALDKEQTIVDPINISN